MGSAQGLSKEKIDALDDYWTSSLYSGKERLALRAADAITLSNSDVSDQLFLELQDYWSDTEILELFALIAWENASSKFNRALRVPSQNLWQEEPLDQAVPTSEANSE